MIDLPSDYLKGRGAKARYSLQPEMTSSPLLSPASQDSPTPSPTFTYKFEHKKYSFKRAQSEDQIGTRGRNESAASRPARQSLCEFETGLYFGKSEDTYRRSLHVRIFFLDYVAFTFLFRSVLLFPTFQDNNAINRSFLCFPA